MTNKSKIHHYIVWFLVSTFYAYQYVIRVLPNIMMAEITEQFQINAGQFGQFSGVYYVGYALVHIPVGILLDRFNLRYILPGCLLLTTAGLAPLIYAEHWIYPTIGRALIGVGSSAAILGCFKVIRVAFDETKFTRMLGMSVTIGLLGAIYGGRPVYFLMEIFGWKQVIAILMGGGCVLACAIFVLGSCTHDKKHERANIFQDIFGLFKNAKVISLCIFGGLMVAPLEGFADVWGGEFLKSVYNLAPGTATQLSSYIFLGACFGASALSYVTEKTQAYYGIIIFSAVAMLAGFLYILSGQASPISMGVVFIIIGILCSYQIPLIYKVSSFVPERLSGMATAFANMVVMLFGYFYHAVIGKAIMCFWDGSMVDDYPFYLPTAYTYGLMVIPAGLAIAACGVGALRWVENQSPLPLREGRKAEE